MNFLTELIHGKNSDFYKKMFEAEKSFLKGYVKKVGGFHTNLPIVKKKKTTINEIVFEQGDVLVRPMYNKLSKFYLKHFGYYYGTDAKGIDYIVNKEADGLIYVRTLEDYMKEINYDEIEIIKKPVGTTIKQIIERGKEIQSEPYTALNNNCQHFINYSVFGNYNSLTSDIVKNDIIEKFKKLKRKKIN